MGETAKRLQEIIDACERGGARTTCGGELCGACIECSARAARVSLQREMLAVSQSLSRVVAVMQAAWIEWRHGRGAEEGMQWIENTLNGPGLIPNDGGTDAQAFFDGAIAEIEGHRQQVEAEIPALYRTLASPADGDVREQVAMEVYVWEHVRRGAEESWARQRWQTETDGMRDLYFEAADRILALIRTPRGEGEASGLAACIITCMGCGQDFDPHDDAQARYHEAACEVVDYEPARVEIARRLRGAALRSDAQEGEADALDLIRWAESQGAALEPVAGNIMPPGTYACYVGDDDDPYMGPGILGAIRAAHSTDRSDDDASM